MSSTKIPNARFSNPLFLALLPWPAVAAGLFVFHSALLAFLFYAAGCLFGTWRLGGFAYSLRPKWPLKVHLVVALASNVVLIGLYQLFGKWLLPADLLLERLATVGVTKASFVWLFPYFLIGNPLVEEFFWRGSQGKGGPFYMAVLFGAWHSMPIFLIAPLWVAPLAVLGIMAVGFALGEVVAKTKTLGDAILLHALAADLPLLIILWIASR
ncbi:CPBP family intramembrane glutamic endopeptidase [Armatimonas sp.]|uniref:CPBP family intramembrane glutamic endopeptidase n=1 Tax=Armatimonas sp. TaxID=1872638 RepID=UPI0037514FFA